MNSRAVSKTLYLRQVMAAILLLIFSVSNYAVQTHIHGSYNATSPAAHGYVFQAPTPGQPADNDEQHCPLCQEYLTGGGVLTSLAGAILPPVFAFAAPVIAVVHIVAPSRVHNWFSRGPPTASR
jgi:hypothetical protein